MSASVRHLDTVDGGLGSLVKVALPSIPGVNLLPGIRKLPATPFHGLSFRRGEVTPDPARVDAYAQVCGFARRDTLPLTYPHLLAFGVQMAIMADPAFPWPAMGAVHLENTLTSHRPIGRQERLAVSTSVAQPRGHHRGEVLDFITSVTSAEELVWESTSSYLVRGRGGSPEAAGVKLDHVVPGTTTWVLPSDLGRRYAAVSGDLNPIHLTALTAKALGFRRQIAHGMWTKARCLAALENRLPAAVRVEVAFKKPVFLPGHVAFGMAAAHPVVSGHPDWDFSLTDPRNGAPHLLGRTVAC